MREEVRREVIYKLAVGLWYDVSRGMSANAFGECVSRAVEGFDQDSGIT